MNPLDKNDLKKMEVFGEKLSTEISFSQESGDECVTCTKYLWTFTIHHGDHSDITDHMKTRGHKSAE
jgi:hypothetical protein